MYSGLNPNSIISALINLLDGSSLGVSLEFLFEKKLLNNVSKAWGSGYHLSLCTFISNGTVRYGCASGFREGGAYQCQKKIEMQKTDGER